MTASARPAPVGTLRLPATSRAVPTSTRLSTRRVPALAAAIVALALAGGVVVGAQATGRWATTGQDALSASAGTGSQSGATGGGGGSSGAQPGAPEDVKGWMTLDQVLAAGFPGVTEAGLRAAFGIPAGVGLDTPLKDLDGTVPGFDVATLREWLAAPH